jgi:hypothetical protein
LLTRIIFSSQVSTDGAGKSRSGLPRGLLAADYIQCLAHLLQAVWFLVLASARAA